MVFRFLSIEVLFLFLPLIYISNTFNLYEFPKFLVFVALIAILFLLNWKMAWSNIASKIDILTIMVLIFGGVVYVANLLGIDPRTSFLGSQFRHQGFITLLAGIGLFFLVRHNNYKDYIRWILAGAFLVSLFAIWQGIAVYIFHNFTTPTYQGRIVGTIGNPNSLAGYLVMVLPFALFNKNKIIKLVLSLMIVVVVIFTDSRSAFLAVGITFLVYGVRLFLKLNFRKIIKVFIIILIVVAFIKFADYTLHKNIPTNTLLSVKERGCPESWPIKYPLKIISDIYNSKIFNVGREAPCDNRLLIWTIGLETLSKRPILGFGQENFEIAVDLGKMHSADNAHNIFLETAISSGVIGLIVFVGIIFTAFKKANFTIRMALLAFLIVAQFNPLSIVEIMLFWFLIALASFKNNLLQ